MANTQDQLLDTQNWRLRRIASLIASVDATTGQQLMLQLPSRIAGQVRALLPEIPQVLKAEQEVILREIQQAVDSEWHTAARPARHEPTAPQHADKQHASSAWKQLASETIVDNIRNERPPIIALVVSQLPTEKAIEILQQLGRRISSQVVQSLPRTNQISPDVRHEIENYLGTRLGEQRASFDNAASSRKQFCKIVAAVPQELQQNWEKAAGAADPNGDLKPIHDCPLQDDSIADSQVLVLPAENDAGETATACIDPAAVIPTVRPVNSFSHSGATPAQPVPAIRDPNAEALRAGFEEILDLPASELEDLLAEADFDTVCLALAGIPPDLIERLRKSIGAEKMSKFDEALRKLGAIQLRDIDEAQSRLLAVLRKHTNVAERPLKKAS